MRVMFTAYAINAALVCLMLTLSLMICDEYSDVFEKFLSLTGEYMMIVFGPLLLVLSVTGLAELPITKECKNEIFVQ